MFVVNSCGELDGAKVNLQLTFSGPPSCHALHSRIVEAFNQTRHFFRGLHHSPPSRGGGSDAAASVCPPFVVSDISIFSVATSTWHALVVEDQLFNGCQTYVFQPEGTLGVSDSMGSMPPPVLPPSLRPRLSDRSVSSASISLARQRSPSGTRLAANSSSNINLSRTFTRTMSNAASATAAHPTILSSPDRWSVACQLFDLIDTNKDDAITLYELRDVMLRMKMDTSAQSVGQSFSLGDRIININTFRRFVKQYPEVAHTLLLKLQSVQALEESDFGRMEVSQTYPAAAPSSSPRAILSPQVASPMRYCSSSLPQQAEASTMFHPHQPANATSATRDPIVFYNSSSGSVAARRQQQPVGGQGGDSSSTAVVQQRLRELSSAEVELSRRLTAIRMEKAQYGH